MRDHDGARILEWLAAGDVVVMVVAVDQVFDGLLGDLLDLGEIGRRRLRPAVADRVGRDHARRRDDEHRLVVLIAENIDVVGALDLGGREQRRVAAGAGLRLGLGNAVKADGRGRNQKRGERVAVHVGLLPLG